MVIGSDLSAIQPPKRLANCSFVQEDSEEKWCFDHKFDYVHLRFVLACFDDDTTMLREAFDNMNPGGWIEYQDVTPWESDAEIYQSIGDPMAARFLGLVANEFDSIRPEDMDRPLYPRGYKCGTGYLQAETLQKVASRSRV